MIPIFLRITGFATLGFILQSSGLGLAHWQFWVIVLAMVVAQEARAVEAKRERD